MQCVIQKPERNNHFTAKLTVHSKKTFYFTLWTTYPNIFHCIQLQYTKLTQDQQLIPKSPRLCREAVTRTLHTA